MNTGAFLVLFIMSNAIIAFAFYNFFSIETVVTIVRDTFICIYNYGICNC